ncbi:amino-acid N-acetyltransferase [Lysinibacter cavernae]|uniref:Amino-acid N-acetyltransferase n=1 Tax=Lysinibacter cavernae TaxID=1640652 RepID=A0A7X5TT59_9MICO|nr:amino-acid N-acetyltransferase [Lysinibacter cavernae]NIH54261.1 amino-acid N-acetyltransferase [Lysinibacter cavernae]
MTEQTTVTVRPARTSDIPHIQRLIEPLVDARILLGKEKVVLYEAVQEFRIAENAQGEVLGCGALHVMWEDLGEVRTLAVSADAKGHGVGRALLSSLEDAARDLGLSRLFCLTFEVDFFERNGFEALRDPQSGDIIDAEQYSELVRSPDEGIAEFLELARVKQNTLGNTRMLKHL